MKIKLTAVILLFVFCGCAEINSRSLQKAFDSAVKPADIYEAVFYAENTSGDFSWHSGYGGRDIDTPMLTASVGKMFITSCILKLQDEGRISLDDKLTMYFNNEQLKGLHVYKDREYSFDLTISDLLFQTSGLSSGSRTYADDDALFSFEERLSAAKNLKTQFAPNSKKKAYYSNINFMLLGAIIEKVTGIHLAEACRQMVFVPLGMAATYLVASENDFVPHTYNGSEKIYRPKNIISSGAAGGFVSTPRDLMAFSKGFWQGKLFDKSLLEKMSVYRELEPYPGPVYYGGGFMRVKLFLGKDELTGHSGVTGSYALYYPKMDMHFVGDFSQLKKSGAPFIMLMKLLIFSKL